MALFICILAIPLLRKHIDFLIERHASLSESGVKLSDGQDEDELLSTSWTRKSLASVVSKGSAHLTKVRSFVHDRRISEFSPGSRIMGGSA